VVFKLVFELILKNLIHVKDIIFLMIRDDKKNTNRSALLFHGFPGDYSVEIVGNFCPNQERYKSVTGIFFHNYFVGDMKTGKHFGFLYSYKTTEDNKEEFGLEIYEI
jgi:hypothetical protein